MVSSSVWWMCLAAFTKLRNIGDILVRYSGRQGRKEGAQFPGRRVTAEGAEKSQQCHKHFLQYSTFAS